MMGRSVRHDRSAVLLIGHGTRDERGTAEFFELSERLASRLEPLPVQCALLEFQHPTVPEAWERLVSAGAQHVHVAPLLLFAAGHAKSDIPDLVKQCQATSSAVSYDQSLPLSRHPKLVDLAVRRIEETMRGAAVRPDSTALVMVGRGSFDPCAQADMKVLSEVVGNRIRSRELATGFYAMAQPRLAALLDQLAASGSVKEIVVYPHLLFTGRLFEAIAAQVEQAARRFDSVRFHLCRYLGPEPCVAEAIADRVEQVSHGGDWRRRRHSPP